jgi:hypothetical protein
MKKMLMDEYVCILYSREREVKMQPAGGVIKAGGVRSVRVMRPKHSSEIRSDRRNGDANFHIHEPTWEVGSSFEQAFSPGSCHESGLKGAL